MADKQVYLNIAKQALDVRKYILKIALQHKIHIGGDLSVADVMAVIWRYMMKYEPANPYWEERDRFVLSKGHGAAVTSLNQAAIGCYTFDEVLAEYATDFGRFGMHSCNLQNPYVEVSTGSLGHGLPISVGLAASAKQKHQKHRVFCMMGDGETCEGSVWEAAMAGRALKLGNLVAVVDRNKQLMTSFSEDSIMMDPYADKWRAFGWNTIEIEDGNDMNQIVEALDRLPDSDGEVPTVVLANTVKGKHISFMERQIKWHAGSLNETDLKTALTDLDKVMEKQRKEL